MGDKAFWATHDALFASQPKLDEADFEAIANKLGLDWAKAKNAIDAGAYDAEIQRDIDDAKSSGILGTPAVVIGVYNKSVAGKKNDANTLGYSVNNRKVVGAQPFEAFEKQIVKALEKAK
jgi:protein-disulfide isomerase